MRYRNIIFLIFGIIFLAVLAMGTTLINDERIDLQGGNILNASIITVSNVTANSPLRFIDEQGIVRLLLHSESETVLNTFAIGNLTPTEVVGASVFNGSVINLDNINGNARFIEINTNNGTSATAGFTMINDLNNRVAFGIGSSTFNRSGAELNNSGLIVVNTPRDFGFVNLFDDGWMWKSNPNDNSSNLALTTTMELDGAGNLNVTTNVSSLNMIVDTVFFRSGAKLDCTPSIEGRMVYEKNATGGNFFACRQEGVGLFEWVMLN